MIEDDTDPTPDELAKYVLEDRAALKSYDSIILAKAYLAEKERADKAEKDLECLRTVVIKYVYDYDSKKLLEKANAELSTSLKALSDPVVDARNSEEPNDY